MIDKSSIEALNGNFAKPMLGADYSFPNYMIEHIIELSDLRNELYHIERRRVS